MLKHNLLYFTLSILTEGSKLANKRKGERKDDYKLQKLIHICKREHYTIDAFK